MGLIDLAIKCQFLIFLFCEKFFVSEQILQVTHFKTTFVSCFQNSFKKNSSIEDVEAFLKKYSKKRIKAIVESVMDGSSLKLMLLPEKKMINLYLCGIKVTYYLHF